jgi:23S rRNA (uracil1939-C5)-methyltransferase
MQTLFDVFGGCGTLGLPLASAFRRVVGIELDSSAVDSANAGAVAHGLHNVSYHRVDLAGGVWPSDIAPVDGDIVIVDPPRAGLHPDFLAVVKRVCPFFVRITAAWCGASPTTLVVARRFAAEHAAAGVRVMQS